MLTISMLTFYVRNGDFHYNDDPIPLSVMLMLYMILILIQVILVVL